MPAKVAGESVILWLSRLFGVLLVPVALMAIFDLAGGLLTSGIPRTAGQWGGFLTMIAAIVGCVAGLTVRSRHSMRRKLIHLLLATGGVIWLGGALFAWTVVF